MAGLPRIRVSRILRLRRTGGAARWRRGNHQPATQRRDKAGNLVETRHTRIGFDAGHPFLADPESQAGLSLAQVLCLAQRPQHGAKLSGGGDGIIHPAEILLKKGKRKLLF